MLTKIELKENHKKCLELLDVFLLICERNNIDYSFGEGSAIGTIRHEGFIPWDINIDIEMTIDEYMKLDFYMKQNEEFLEEKNMRWCISKEKGRLIAWLIHKDSLENKTCPNIDINIFIGITSNLFLQKLLLFIIYFNYKIYKLRNTKVKRRYPYNILKKICAIFPYELQIKLIKKLCIMKKIENSEYLINLSPGFLNKCEIIPQKWLKSEKNIKKFENRNIKIMEEYDEYLKNRYGNYMEPIIWENKGIYKGQ